MNPIRHSSRFPLSSLSLVLMLTGCASVLNTASHDEFACPGMPEGVTCKSPSQVYRATHGTLPDVTPVTTPDVQAASVAKDPSPALTLPQHLPTTLPDAQSASPQLPLPVLEPAKVMRIWIAPWEDSKKDLHWPSYLFTEIQPRKWSFGKAEFTGSRPVIPHLMLMPSAQPALPDRPESGQVGAFQPASSPQAVTGIPEAALPQAGDALLGGR